MGASSVTGVGQGSADKSGQKGSEHLFVGVEKLIGTRVWYTGKVVMTAGTQVVTLPKDLPGVDGDWMILVTDQTAAAAVGVTANAVASAGTFTIAGTSGHTLGYSVVLMTNATVTTWPVSQLG
jgi:hypothetical protein